MAESVFPRLIDRIILRTEGIVLLLGGIFLLLTYHAPNDVQREGVVRAITSDIGVNVFAVLIAAAGGWLWWSVRKKSNAKRLTWALFACFLLRTYVLIASILTAGGWTDAPYLSHIPETVVLGGYYLVIRVNAQHR